MHSPHLAHTPLPLHDWLAQALAVQASDLHLRAGSTPQIRVAGALQALRPAVGLLTHEALLSLLAHLVPQPLNTRFLSGQEVDFAFALPDLGRFRVNAFMQAHGCAAVMRLIPSTIPRLETLHAPLVLPQLLNQVGLLLVTGATGSGKSTTLAAMVQHLNMHTRQHVVTLEDPIEFVHHSAQCLITQREVGTHSQSFTAALRAALRQDPDVILVGELRDQDTIRLALSAAETGHLVLASLHTRNAPASIERMVDVFDGHEKALVRTQLSDALVGVLSQTLCPTPDGAAQCGVFEMLVATPAIRHLIREGKTSQILNAMQTGAAHGMQTMAQAMEMAIAQQRIRPTPPALVG